MSTDLTTSIQKTFNELHDIIYGFSDDQYNQIPFEGSWTAGQVVEHILKTLRGIPQLMQGAVPSPGRVPDEKLKALEGLFLDFSIQMQAPDFVAPGEEQYEKTTHMELLKERQRELEQSLQQDLSLVCMGFEFPQFGYFTRLEWIHFFRVHTQRHTRQLINILTSLNRTA